MTTSISENANDVKPEAAPCRQSPQRTERVERAKQLNKWLLDATAAARGPFIWGIRTELEQNGVYACDLSPKALTALESIYSCGSRPARFSNSPEVQAKRRETYRLRMDEMRDYLCSTGRF